MIKHRKESFLATILSHKVIKWITHTLVKFKLIEMLCLIKMFLEIGSIIILKRRMSQLNHSSKKKLAHQYQHQSINQVNIPRKRLVVALMILILLNMSIIVYLTHYLRSFGDCQNYIEILNKFLILMLNNMSFIILQLMN